MLVRVAILACIGLIDPSKLEWTGGNWLGAIQVDDLFHLMEVGIGEFYTVTGIIHYDGAAKLEPRDATDITDGAGLREQTIAEVMVYPNPVADVLTLALSRGSAPRNYVLTDAVGRAVRSGRTQGERTHICVDGLAGGHYVLRVYERDTTWSASVQIRR